MPRSPRPGPLPLVCQRGLRCFRRRAAQRVVSRSRRCGRRIAPPRPSASQPVHAFTRLPWWSAPARSPPKLDASTRARAATSFFGLLLLLLVLVLRAGLVCLVRHHARGRTDADRLTPVDVVVGFARLRPLLTLAFPGLLRFVLRLALQLLGPLVRAESHHEGPPRTSLFRTMGPGGSPRRSARALDSTGSACDATPVAGVERLAGGAAD